MDCNCSVTVRVTENKGRCLFAVKPIACGNVAVCNHIIKLDQSIGQDPGITEHEFSWPDGGLCLTMGAITFANHSSTPNCSLKPNEKDLTMSLVALRDISPDEELTYNYDCELWFAEL
ncbi:SET domain-containing protein-lysine N-methyltransferase [Myxococcota bacterium]|nr:SET domain-containing protein-lysine N-methyltransferase [Myxococcota bacterium]MBU1380630.1 SET domain-containing protein-lysine N-methyltransferase [Myxococcota bacterium]MBU1496973.1 SET domain-containing protein-lysine N-methyltransferase [Myxococcota bacterium]